MSGKRPGFRTRVILIATVLIIGTNLVLGTILALQSRNAMKAQINERMLDIVNTAAAMLDGDVIDELTAEDKGTPEYEAVYNILSRFMNNINLDYIYYVRDAGGGNFTFGIDPDPVAPGEFGSPVVYTDALYKASLGEPSVDEIPYEDKWGRFYSAFSPVFNSSGEVSGVVTADFNAEWYEEHINRNQMTIIIGVILFAVAGIAVALFMTRQYNREMKLIEENLDDLNNDLSSLTSDSINYQRPENDPGESYDDIRSLGKRISDLRNELRFYITNTTTQANNMITAMASDYSSVYHVNLDKDECVCYRTDHSNPSQPQEGNVFPFREGFRHYAELYVAENYLDGFLQFIDPDNIRKALETQPIIAYRYLVRRDGEEIYEMIRMAGVRRAEDRDDHIVHAIGLGLTRIDAEMRETLAKNQALGEALAMAEEANAAKTAFLSNMSHEIRTPMNAIIGLNNLALNDNTLQPQTRDYLEKTGESARHLLSLINDILDMSRRESGRVVLNKEEFSFSGMLEQINTMVMSQCEDKGLKYECHVINHVDDYYIGDDLKLKEILINILSNAIKFTDAPGNVTLSVERTAVFDDQSTLRFRIKDTGIGMDKSYIPKIFDSFTQEDSTRKNKYGSTGLGMAITKSLVEMMNGTIDVESEKGVGTEFSVALTLKNSDRRDENAEEKTVPDNTKVQGSESSEDASGPAGIEGMRVLLAEDIEVNAEIMMDILEMMEIYADHAENGKIAVEMFASSEPGTYGAILMDIRMPVMDGLEAAAAIRALDRQDAATVPIIALTANAFDEDVQQSLQAGMNAHLSKPVEADVLFRTIEELAYGK